MQPQPVNKGLLEERQGGVNLRAIRCRAAAAVAVGGEKAQGCFGKIPCLLFLGSFARQTLTYTPWNFPEIHFNSLLL